MRQKRKGKEMSKFYHMGEEHMMASCWSCKVKHSIPISLYKSAIESQGEISIKCPYGHAWVYKTQRQVQEDEIIRQERDRLKQRIAEKDDDIARLEREKSAAKGQVTKIKNRIAGGVCPCCNRYFLGLERHMSTKHKDYKKEAA
jgi:hypothetical protein